MSLCGFGSFGLIIALGRFDNQAIANRLGGDLDSNYLAIDQGANLLDVGFELAFTDAGNLAAHATKVFGFTAAGDAAAGTGSFAGKKAFS
jgi:hypothetical protein